MTPLSARHAGEIGPATEESIFDTARDYQTKRMALMYLDRLKSFWSDTSHKAKDRRKAILRLVPVVRERILTMDRW